VKPLRVLRPSFFHRPAPEVARDLLGAVIVSCCDGARVSGRIVETEAYLGFDDPASHAWRGRRHAQNEGLYCAPGTWYVYRSYGVHWCANLVCAPVGLGAAVLLRGLEPLDGIDVMRRRRASGQATLTDATLSNGPGKLCQAFGITRALDQTPMADSIVKVHVAEPVASEAVRITPRIGITKAVDLPLRFVIRDRSRRSQ
jgi:DNA-3-methyladenine glycosylase